MLFCTGIIIAKGHRKKMDEYLVEMMLSQKENLSDEGFIIEVLNQKLHTNRRKRLQNERYKFGKSFNN